MDTANIKSLAEEFRLEFDRQFPEMMELLRELVMLDSFSPDGAGVDEAGKKIQDWLKDAGFLTKTLPRPASDPRWSSYGHAVSARTDPNSAGIAFIGHMDTVFKRGTAAERPFRMEGGYAYGPGVADMKGGIVALLFVARLLRQKQLLRTPLSLLFSPEEECGSPVVYPQFRQEIGDAAAVFSAEPGFPGGGITVERFGCGEIHLDVTGKAGHAARDFQKCPSAITEICRQAVAISGLSDLSAGRVVNIGRISGGESASTIAAHAEADIFFCVKDMEQCSMLLDDVKEIASHSFIPGTVTETSGGIGLYPMPDNPGSMKLFSFARRAAQTIDFPVFANRTQGSSDAGYCSSVLGIPSLCSLGPEGTFLHSDKEQLDLSTFVPKCIILALSAIQASEAADELALLRHQG